MPGYPPPGGGYPPGQPSGGYPQPNPGGSALRRVQSYYLPQNTGTAIDEVTIELANKESQPTLKEAGGKPRNPTLKVRWKVDNQDGDDTAYVLAVRRDGE